MPVASFVILSLEVVEDTEDSGEPSGRAVKKKKQKKKTAYGTGKIFPELFSNRQGATPTAVFVQPQVGYKMGSPGAGELFDFKEQDREAYYRSVHLQTIQFEIARQIVWALTVGTGNGTPRLRLQSRHQLFPQVYRLVEEYVAKKVDFRGENPCELVLETYVQRTVERLLEAIEPDNAQGEPPLMPILNRFKKIGSTAEVNFKTTRPCFSTIRSHINSVVADTRTWEQSAAFRLEQTKLIYAKNDHLEFSIPFDLFLSLPPAFRRSYPFITTH